MFGQQPWDEDDRENDVTRVRDEAVNKNAIRNRMRIDRIDLAPDRLSGIISVGRDFFHTFVNGTLGRRYKRPPIYLVDGWVVGALGAFMDRGRRRVPDLSQKRAGRNDLELGTPLTGLAPALNLFQELHQVQELLSRVKLLNLEGPARGLEQICLSLAVREGDLRELGHTVHQIVELVDRAASTLKRDLFVGPHVNKDVVPLLSEAVHGLMQAASFVEKAPLPELPGTGFSAGRPSGVLFGSIPELDIEGPAILLAPARIVEWSHHFRDIEKFARRLGTASMESWFGVRAADQLPAAVGLVKTLHHEMTHAMVCLPTDPVQDEALLFEQRWQFYDQHPGFEEGFCDATAVLCTGITLLKALYDIKGRGLPRLHDSRYSDEWMDVERSLRPLWYDHHGDATRTWLHAWERSKRDFKAFSGVIGLYSTNFGGFDWMRTFAEFQNGQISTGRQA